MPRLKVYDLASGTWLYAGGVDPVALATDVAFTSRFASETSGAGAPAGTGTNAQWYYDTTNDRLYVSDGVGWIIMYEPDQVYTPAFPTGVTIGNGTRDGVFRRQGGRCSFEQRLTFGSTSAITGNVTATLPKGAARLERGQLMPVFTDAGGSISIGWNNRDSLASPTIGATVTSGAYASASALSTSIPFAWGTGCELALSGEISMTTPYL